MDRYFHLNGTQIRQSHMIGRFLGWLLHENYCTHHVRVAVAPCIYEQRYAVCINALLLV
jgi:hypothetical protein